MTVKVLALVEGQTEERFAKQVLASHLAAKGIILTPIIVKTRSDAGRAPFRGGSVKYQEFKRQALRLLADSSASAVTTLLDYYGLSADFPGCESQSNSSPPRERVRLIEEEIKQDIGHPRFLPFLMLHEFETLLFSSPSILASSLAPAHGKKDESKTLSAILQEHRDDPEMINDSPDTAPSKRLKAIYGEAFQKANFGPLIASRIGLKAIREKCVHFNEWVEVLESLGKSA